MNETELQNNYKQAIIHYLKINNKPINEDLFIVNFNFNTSSLSIDYWGYTDIPQPSPETLKTYTLEEITNSFKDYSFGLYFKNIEKFFKFYNRYIYKEIQVLKGNPEPTDEESDQHLVDLLEIFKANNDNPL